MSEDALSRRREQRRSRAQVPPRDPSAHLQSSIVQSNQGAQSEATLALLESADLTGADLSSLAAIAREAHQSVRAFEGEALRAGRVAGRALLAARERYSYDREAGGFRGWVEESTGISRATAYNYLALAQYFDKVSNCWTLSEAYAAIAQLKRQKGLLEPAGTVTLAPRKTFQEPKRLRAIANTLVEAFSDVEPMSRDEEALLKRVEDLIGRLQRMAEKGQ